jgi:hypothetical protein
VGVAGTNGGSADDSGGCGCTVPVRRDTTFFMLLATAAFGALAFRRRSR